MHACMLVFYTVIQLKHNTIPVLMTPPKRAKLYKLAISPVKYRYSELHIMHIYHGCICYIYKEYPSCPCMCLTLVYMYACMHTYSIQTRFQQSLPQQANPFASPVKRAIFGRPTNRKLCFVHTNNDGWCACIYTLYIILFFSQA